ncbi:hypothetical protein F442_15444 [Phytophthora nicotianae P10297]|uniref:FYVE-type domain-containing protein n=3 Tax=Phytophthora nicotianae TaxID=4792 RepID=W2R1T3_PHYN3|nr:hypothetical protein PPTG_04645 [Phytophthora nicotianae INRA-310]ETM38761.1 hypothetical protein L914_15014 [Phytophthora nicotianae]ETN19288.1 hypothetical protein PPTG_04645 [Phytophthora nicotianae INRA-310]ETP36667.1 hypothetical protein F442_15444 [Phytophthora nicotianae P10297]KUF80378.1 hypothetical protein AM587_10015628 [Phytophthora nicotianae]
MASRGSPFEPLQLTEDEEKDCYDRAFQLLERTLRSYDERDAQGDGGRLHHSKLDSSKWKLLKTQANASMYVAHNNAVHQDDGAGGEIENAIVLLTAGTIRGDLDEVMLGVKSIDVNSISFRTELPGNHPVDCAVLAELLGPKEVDPFRFLGVTWLMYENSWPIKAMMRPRDLLTLTATGTMTRSNGDRIGYEVVLPVRLPQCPLLSGTVRNDVMYAAIFKQQEPGIVDVYIPTYVESQSTLLDKVVTSVTWKATLAFWDALQLGEMKKLQWSIANCRMERQKEQKSSSACKRCSERPSMLKRFGGIGHNDKNSCVLCDVSMCSECRVERSLKVPDENSGRLKDQIVGVCLPCVMFVRQLRPTDIAMFDRKQRRPTSII